MSTPTPPTSGWYDDPQDPAYLRYFDGVVWSDHRAPKETPVAAPVEPVSPPTGQQPAWGQPQQPGQAQSQGQWAQPGPAQQPWGQQGQPQWGQPGQPQWGHSQWAQQPLVPSAHGYPLAGWWWRVLALVIDRIVVGLVSTLVTLPLTMPYINRFRDYWGDVIDASRAGSTSMPPLPDPDGRFLAGSLLAAVILFLYDAVCTARWGRTLGKRITRLRVLDTRAPQRLGWGRAFARSAVKHVDALLGALPLLDGLANLFTLLDRLWPLWDRPLRQSLHDKAVGSLVIRE